MYVCVCMYMCIYIYIYVYIVFLLIARGFYELCLHANRHTHTYSVIYYNML